MIDPVKITDEEITAYLDGEFEYTLAAEIENAINNNPAFASRVKALSIDKQNFEKDYDGLLEKAPRAPNFANKKTTLNKSFSGEFFGLSGIIIGKIVAVACLVLLLGAGIGSYSTNYSQPKWINYVASYQSLYSKNTLAHINQNELEATQELKRVSAAIGRDIALENLKLPDILNYKRAQILNFRGQDLMQITYLSKSGVPIALCIMRFETTGQKPEAPQFNTLEGMQSGYWQQGGYQFFLIGGTDDALIKILSNEFKNRIL
ncbi:MAG: hypothetical protein COC00_013785 [Rhizobiales bacterium]|nr:hypothetical protein [Hyphomicrobiales bacterium]